MRRFSPYTDIELDLETERKFWEAYDDFIQRLPGGGFESAWPAILIAYGTLLHHPHDMPSQTITRIAHEEGEAGSGVSEYIEIVELVGRRMNLLASQARRRHREAAASLFT